jgi:hypothetical protein
MGIVNLSQIKTGEKQPTSQAAMEVYIPKKREKQLQKLNLPIQQKTLVVLLIQTLPHQAKVTVAGLAVVAVDLVNKI